MNHSNDSGVVAPAPVFINTDPQAIVRSMTASYEQATGQKLYPAQVEQLLINLFAYEEYTAIEAIVSPGTLYLLLTDVDRLATISSRLNQANPRYLRFGLRLVREDGSCIDFASKAKLDSFLADSKDIFDVEFLHQSEGHTSVVIVPGEDSGLTIGWGVDIGHKSEAGLVRWGVPQTIIDKIRPYLGITGAAATAALDRITDRTLGLSEDEINQLSEITKQRTVASIIAKYNTAINERGSGIGFDKIPYKTRTAIIDLFYQYAPGTAAENGKVPRSWNFVITNDWNGLPGELRNFGDDHGTRRNREADLVSDDIDNRRYIYQ